MSSLRLWMVTIFAVTSFSFVLTFNSRSGGLRATVRVSRYMILKKSLYEIYTAYLRENAHDLFIANNLFITDPPSPHDRERCKRNFLISIFSLSSDVSLQQIRSSSSRCWAILLRNHEVRSIITFSASFLFLLLIYLFIFLSFFCMFFLLYWPSAQNISLPSRTCSRQHTCPLIYVCFFCFFFFFLLFFLLPFAFIRNNAHLQ